MQNLIMCKSGIVDDGGIVVNCAVRQFMRGPTGSDYRVLNRLFRSFMPYMTDKILLVAIRDLMPWSVDDFGSWDPDLNQLTDRERAGLSDLRAFLMTVYLLRRNAEKPFHLERGNWDLLHEGHRLECIQDDGSRGLFETGYDFVLWAEDALQRDVEFQTAENTDTIPLPEEFVPDIRRITVLAARYASNRYTYVPGSVVDFVRDNREFFDPDTLEEIADAVREDQVNACWNTIRQMCGGPQL